MSSQKTCVVTGGRGYLGSEVMAYLQGCGWRAICAARSPQPREIGYTLGGDWPVRSLEGVDAIVHCAYDFGPSKWADIYETNVVGTRRLLDQARRAGVSIIVTISSISAYPGCRSLYGQAKILMEGATLAAGGVALRPGLIHGGRDQGMFGRLASQARSKRRIPLLVGSPCTQFLVQVADLCRLIEEHLSGRVSRPEKVLTVAHPRPWPLRELLSALSGERQVEFIPVPWQFAWGALRVAELVGLRPAFKSDSVLGIVYRNTDPDFSGLPFVMRPFQPGLPT